ncbi:MAG: salicylyl-CoA 5-hydroxylase [Betaproteobacteria bacterium RBG_16_64_18]|nr:MAG: salicylyl-CoA 5-hydroxylase [Betaproteobacteria bacterium RBG_16_64_18]
MRIVCIGAGPAGLYFSILMKLADARHEVTVLERDRPDDTFGFGVVFSDATLDNLRDSDPETHRDILASFRHWDDIDIHYRGEVIVSGGHGMCGIHRRRLLNILQARAAGLGVRIEYETDVTDDSRFAGADLVVAADGINSAIRSRYAGYFKPDLEPGKCRFMWFGASRSYEAFVKAFERTEHGWFEAHVYPHEDTMSTFIVECHEQTYLAHGLDSMSLEESLAFSERVFAKLLDGAKLIGNARHPRGSQWLNFVRVLNQRWAHGNIVLMGDAAHTAHFSIGSGTKLAMEDAIALEHAFRRHESVPEALAAYESERRTEVARLQSAARNSMQWSENVERYSVLEPVQFAYSLMTRSQRVGHDNLKLRDARFVELIEAWLSRKSGAGGEPRPPMFTPFRLRGMELANRVVVSPMAMYSASDGLPGEFHLVHLGTRAHGGAALVFTEMVCVAPDARITPGCAGLWNAAQAAAWTRIVDYVHRGTAAKIGIQLGHAGPKGATRVPWEGENEPLEEGGWPLVAPSALAWSAMNALPRSMTRRDMNRVRGEFVRAAKRAAACGFDMLELHCAHGYLLSAFISPLTNRRTDGYGGNLEGRLRFPLDVFRALRDAWPENRPMSVRISAVDWAEGGTTPEEAVQIARAFKHAGADLIDVSSGQTSTAARPVYGRMYQTPLADRIRNEARIATMAVGAITEPDQVNSIVAAGRADLCALARPHLTDPYWTLHAAAQLRYTDQAWPNQYLSGRAQLERNLERAAQTALNA